MKTSLPLVNYRGFRLSRITEPQYKHLWYLLFFPIYWLRYPLIENLNPAKEYHPIYCPLDDSIPFCEWFIIPYMLWMPLMAAVCVYTMFYDVDSFKWYMKFLVACMSISTVIFLVYPSCQNLRPEVFPRDNLLCDAVSILYSTDTNTNVFPSEHAIGSIAVWLAVLRTKSLCSKEKIVFVTVLTVLAGFFTVFLKQHSVLDIAAVAFVCAVSFLLCKNKRN